MYDSTVSQYELTQLSLYSDVLRTIFGTLKNEMFRQGFEHKPKTTIENPLQEEKIIRVEEKANLNNQTLTEVFQEIEQDLNVVDDAYLFARKNYLVNEDNEIIGGEVIEFIRLNPNTIKMMFDRTSRLGFNEQGQPIYFDPSNRGELVHTEFNRDGRKNMRACFEVRSAMGKKKKVGSQFYDTSEIIHVSKYNPTKTYGFSNLYSLYNKVMTLINMDYYIKQYYSGNKVPKGILTVNTSNATSFNTFWDTFIEKVRKNPHAVNPLVHQAKEGNKEFIKWIDFMRNLQEMQYTEVRNEIRTQIGAEYNVSPIFQNDVSTSGGLNNEGLQITVTDRGVEMGQLVYNSKLLPWMKKQLGISDYEWKLLPSQEEDQLAEKELRLKDLQIAKATAELGIIVTMNETGEFSYSEGKVELQETQAPGMDSFFKIAKSCQGTDIKKKDISSVPNAKEVESALLNELEKLLKKFDSKKSPSKKELEKKISETVKDFEKIVKTKSSRKLKAIYQKAMNDLGKTLDRTFTITDIDKNVIEALKKQPQYQKAFSNMSQELSNNLRTAVTAAYAKPEGFSIDGLVKDMKTSTEATESSLRRIARAETTKISIASRKVQYDKTGKKVLYRHIGPGGPRTSEASTEIKRLTKDGVSWDEYVDIVTKVSKKFNPKWVVDKNAPMTNPNTRHIPVGRIVQE